MRNKGDYSWSGIDVKNDLSYDSVVDCDDSVLFSILFGSGLNSFDGFVGQSWDQFSYCSVDSLELLSCCDGLGVCSEDIHLSQLIDFLHCLWWLNYLWNFSVVHYFGLIGDWVEENQNSRIGWKSVIDQSNGECWRVILDLDEDRSAVGQGKIDVLDDWDWRSQSWAF